jgi:hypothetical protein
MSAFDGWVQKARGVSIEDVIAQRGIKLVGKIDRCGPCPVCGGEDRFSINTRKQLFHCRQCDVGGDVIALVRHLDGIDFKAAVEVLTGEPPPTKKKANGKDRKAIIATYDYIDENGTLLFQVVRYDPKSFRQRRPDGKGGWVWDLSGVRRVLFKLPELIEAVKADRLVYIVEGERDVLSLNALGLAATCNPGGAGKWRVEYGEFLREADVMLLPDADDAGHKHMQGVGAALHGIAKRVRVLVLPAAEDATEWFGAGRTLEELNVLVEKAPDWIPTPAADETKKQEATDKEQQLIDELARLDRIEYDRRRRDAARTMGIRSGSLDDAVDARRAENTAKAGPPPLFGHWIVEPWPEPVDGDALLLQIMRRLQEHVSFTHEQAITVALWVVMAWAHGEAAVHSPYLLATSAEANSGKTTLLNLISFLAPRALLCVGISEAALFRSIELWGCSIVVDEADTILIDNEPLRSVINTGHTRGAVVPRCIGDAKVPHGFPTFCPKAIGMKGRRLPDTTISRCIIIEMKRKKSGVRVRHFRVIDDDNLRKLREQAFRWVNDNVETLKNAEPTMPAWLDNRVGDLWWLMFAIADLAGGDWPELARGAARAVTAASDVTSIGVQLLGDIKAIFVGGGLAGEVVITSQDLVGKLTSDQDCLWSEWRSAKPLTQNQLARLLKPFGIAPQQVRLKTGRQVRGYSMHQFEDVWERYLPSKPS